ncbi:hypothetical protein N7466_006231 [Penicillium verhagenii]|uniref:uncharacterized protein n=1 Tax=Penicillium verhagenii TaxID=1562060 RepID=UPI0025451E6C|nr:uncharacterized protein N7466_006231 [Penicillium verhagenii]KAJ5930738.1 hypothetical protein N7466_006231 [Penicillium verhagenii]
MAAHRVAPTGVFEPQRTSSFRGLQPATHKYASEEGDKRTTYSEMSQGVSDYEEEEEEVDETVREDMNKLEDTFPGISERFRLVNRIGEVYKAEDLLYDHYENDWDVFGEAQEQEAWPSPPSKRRRIEGENVRHKKPRYVALKKIYVTSSPIRIQNELELLHDLRGCPSVCPLITAFRFQDQVVAVLPYFPHTDFRIQYRTFLVADMRHYLRSLLTALSAVHEHEILHRDIKPTYGSTHSHCLHVLNDLKEGVLVDFGLAERQGAEYTSACLCTHQLYARRSRIITSYYSKNPPSGGLSTGYPKNDSRSSRRANRAGTRGFRAPEVLFKCTSQTTKIDMWSVGVILLILLGRRFPFFNSADDIDAMIEMSSIFGTRRMKTAAAMHGQIFETNVPTIGEKGYSWEKLVKWSSCVEDLTESEQQATRLLSGLMELDPTKRLSADEALQHEFFTSPVHHDVEWGGNPEESGESAEDDEAGEDEADEVAML